MVPADIRRLTPEAFEFLWSTILRREHGAEYARIDGHGLDCLTRETAYQIYHHQGASWAVVQRKFRDDLKDARAHLAAGRYRFRGWIFVTTFAFKDPSHREWLGEQKGKALPLVVNTWGDEDLCDQLARHPDLAGWFGLGPSPQPTVLAAIHAQGGAAGGHGISIVGGVKVESKAPPDLPLEPRAILTLETLLDAREERLTPAELQRRAAPEASASDFKLLLHGLVSRGLVYETAPQSEWPPQKRMLFHGQEPVPALVYLAGAGKDYLVRLREQKAAKDADRQYHADFLKGTAEASKGLRRRSPWRVGRDE